MKMKKSIDVLPTVLKDKKNVVTRANFWKIPHDTRTDEVCLKVGRYKKSRAPFVHDELESEEPKSELTLDERNL